MRAVLGRVAYGMLFCAALPLGLAAWCAAVEPRLALPRLHLPLAGVLLAVLGLALIAASTLSLVVRGGGWPMNAFPPVRLVASGTYRWIENPIYWGFVLVVAGGSIGVGSAAGLWVALPTSGLGVTALVIGYEREATLRRLGPRPVPPLLTFPPREESPARWNDRCLLAALLVLWAIMYEWVGHLPVPDGFSMWMQWEHRAPVLVWTESIYVLAYPAAISCILLVRTRSEAARLAELVVVACVVGGLLYLMIPAVSPPRPFEGEGLWAGLLKAERADGLDGRASFPSFHVFWACAAASVWSVRFQAFRIVWWVLALAITVSCWTTGMHPVADLAAGVVFWWVAARWRVAAQIGAALAERIANSWREFRVGRVRFISHGAFAGLGAFLGVLGASLLAGPGVEAPLGAIAVTALVGAGLWGQYFVGNASLLRPFGYFGSVLGAVLGLALVAAIGWMPPGSPWRLAAALAAIAPFVQAIGRLRCLVQGCCHGRPTRLWIGIRYRHPRSRVCRLANLTDVPVHPTPLYSICGNIAMGVLLLRLSLNAVPAEFVVGGYLFGAGVLRFIEEHFRGEPSTPVVRGLRLYQWFAVASVCIGFAVAAIQTGVRTETAATGPVPSVLPLAAGVGLLYWLAMGVDFPSSTKRFSRLV